MPCRFSRARRTQLFIQFYSLSVIKCLLLPSYGIASAVEALVTGSQFDESLLGAKNGEVLPWSESIMN